MIVKTGANYQAEGGYVEASINNGIITIVKNDDVISFNDTNSIVTGFVPLKITNSTSGGLYPGCLAKDGDVEYIGSSLTEIQAGATKIVNVPRDVAFRLGYSASALNSSTPNVEILHHGNQYYARIVNYPEDGLSVTFSN